MRIPLVDCDAWVGRRGAAEPGVSATVDALLEEMDRVGIEQAVVTHYSAVDATPRLGNRLVDELCAPHQRLHRAWCLLPPSTREMGAAGEMVGRMLEAGVRVARLFPKTHGFCFAEWCIGDLLAALESRRVPVQVPLGEIAVDDLWRALNTYPRLPVVLMEVGYRANRLLYPLLARFPNLCLSIAPRYSVHRGIEDVCARFGAERLLFGSGFPAREAGAAVAALTYAMISEREKRLIGSENMRRVLAAVQMPGKAAACGC